MDCLGEARQTPDRSTTYSVPLGRALGNKFAQGESGVLKGWLSFAGASSSYEKRVEADQTDARKKRVTIYICS